MKKENIIIKLEEIKNDSNSEQRYEKCQKLIDMLREELREEPFKVNASNTKRINVIKKLLNDKKKTNQVLSAFTPYKGGVVVTDGYQLFSLKDKTLPFDVCFTADTTDEEKKEYVKEYGNNVISGSYPNMATVINDNSKYIIKVNIKELINFNKTTLKNEKGMKIITYTFDGDKKIIIDTILLINAINVLKLNDDFELHIESEFKPVYIYNNDEELALFLPIRVY